MYQGEEGLDASTHPFTHPFIHPFVPFPRSILCNHLEALEHDRKMLWVEPVKHDAVGAAAIGCCGYPPQISEQADNGALLDVEGTHGKGWSGSGSDKRAHPTHHS